MTAVAERPRTDDLPTHGPLLIGSDKVTNSSGGQYQHVFAGTGQQNAVVELAGQAEVDAAVAAGWEAQKEWMSWGIDRRRDMIIALADAVRDNLDEFRRLNVHDYAVPYAHAYTSMICEKYLRYNAGFIDKAHGQVTDVSGGGPHDINLIEREPYGVVTVFAPWNGPMLVVGMNAGAAIAAGNAVILKPGELSPFAPLKFGELCLEVGLPPGLVSVLPAGPEGGEAIVRHKGIRKIHFTGGGPTARKVMQGAAENLTPLVLELGGKSANVIFEDADLDFAAFQAAFQGPLTQSGQSCACGSRIFVQDTVYDRFMEKFLGAIASAKIGDPFDPEVTFGPVITQQACDRILSVIDQAVDEKAGELVLGGKRLGGELANGYFIEPTVFSNVDNNSALAREETFGPVVSVIPFKEEAEAIRLANDTDYGLNAFVLTRDIARARRVAQALESGSVWVNHMSDMQPQSPYGGYKQSGFGRAGGLEGYWEFLQVKNTRFKF